jgi:uncharacterized protein YerC
MNPESIKQVPVISAMLANNERLECIAATTGLSFGTVCKIRKALATGQPLTRKPHVRKHMFNTSTRPHIKRVKALAAVGYRRHHISQMTGLAFNTVNKILKCN